MPLFPLPTLLLPSLGKQSSHFVLRIAPTLVEVAEGTRRHHRYEIVYAQPRVNGYNHGWHLRGFTTFSYAFSELANLLHLATVLVYSVYQSLHQWHPAHGLSLARASRTFVIPLIVSLLGENNLGLAQVSWFVINVHPSGRCHLLRDRNCAVCPYLYFRLIKTDETLTRVP